MRKKVDINPDLDLLLKKLDDKASNICLLSGDGQGWSNKIAWNPCDEFRLKHLEDLEGLKKFITEHQNKQHLVIGYLSYDLGQGLRGTDRPKRLPDDSEPATFFAYDEYLEEENGQVFAEYSSRKFITYLMNIDKNVVNETTNNPVGISFKKLWGRSAYSRAFLKIRQYIYDGIVYQINLTQELKTRYQGNPRSLFLSLSAKNKAKMKAYFEAGNLEIISMSPERFVQTRGRVIETSPIKGTRPRGKDEKQDKENQADLMNDEKEKAELNMITDLMRNDLGRVCEPGSIQVIKRQAVEKLTAVMHTFSLIRGNLTRSTAPFDALLSMFPGGSITGCPKIKAMQIINELEQSARGIYCGSLVVIDSAGNLDSSILIRTVIKKGDELSLSVGSGIVYDSQEQKEYEENIEKAKSLVG